MTNKTLEELESNTEFIPTIDRTEDTYSYLEVHCRRGDYIRIVEHTFEGGTSRAWSDDLSDTDEWNLTCEDTHTLARWMQYAADVAAGRTSEPLVGDIDCPEVRDANGEAKFWIEIDCLASGLVVLVERAADTAIVRARYLENEDASQLARYLADALALSASTR